MNAPVIEYNEFLRKDRRVHFYKPQTVFLKEDYILVPEKITQYTPKIRKGDTIS